MAVALLRDRRLATPGTRLFQNDIEASVAGELFPIADEGEACGLGNDLDRGEEARGGDNSICPLDHRYFTKAILGVFGVDQR
jgi:hypothetical protein